MPIILTSFLILAIISVVVFFIYIPIMVANVRGIVGTEKTTIVVLSWLGILFGVTWVVALVLSLIRPCTVTADSNSLDQLEKLAKLHKDKVISKSEYERMKAKIIPGIED
jgi:uncharacterized membrane protein